MSSKWGNRNRGREGRDITIHFSMKWLWILAGIIFLAWLSWATAPMFHWLWFDVIWMHPTGLILFIAIAAIAITSIVIAVKSHFGWGFWITMLVLTTILIAYPLLADDVARWYMVKDIQPIKLQSLPDTTEVRFLPMEIAERYAANRMQDPTHHVGDIDPLDLGTELNWVGPREPTGDINRLFGKTDGFIVVHPDGSVTETHQEVKYGEGMYLTHSIYWQLYRINYFTYLPEVYYFEIDKEMLGIVPYISYRYQFPVRVPYWGGVYIVHPDGKIEDLTPEQAITDKRFESMRLYPEYLARRIADCWAYRGGVTNKWWTHTDQTEVPTIQNAGNQMPYLIPIASGSMWFTGLEPYGPAYSVYKIMLVDTHNGQLAIFELPKDSGLIGPNRALDYIKAAFPMYQWYNKGAKESSGSILVIEPRPLIKNGRLFWMATVTNIQYASVTETPLVDSQTNAVITFKNLDELKAFLTGRFEGHKVTVTSNQQLPAAQPTSETGPDVTKMSDKDLTSLLKQIADELARRSAQIK